MTIVKEDLESAIDAESNALNLDGVFSMIAIFPSHGTHNSDFVVLKDQRPDEAIAYKLFRTAGPEESIQDVYVAIGKSNLNEEGMLVICDRAVHPDYIITTIMDDLVSAHLIPPSTSANIIKEVKAIINHGDGDIFTMEVSLGQKRPEGATAYCVLRHIIEPTTEYVVIRGNLDEDGMLQISKDESVRPHYITT